MNIYITSEQVGLEGYWITDILDGIFKESLKKHINVIDFVGQKIETSLEAPRPIVLVVGYSTHWMEKNCSEIRAFDAMPLLVNADHGAFSEMMGPVGIVSFDLKKSVYNVLSYFLGAKRSKICFFGAQTDSVADDIKAEEFLRIASLWKLPISYQDVYRSGSIAECYNVFSKSIENYNAVFCSSDAAALYLVERCKEKGIRIPQDLAVIGCGDTRVCAKAQPAISTVKNDYVELGRQAVKLHQLLQKNTDINSASISVDCPLVLRSSTPGASNIRMYRHKMPENKVPGYVSDPELLSVLKAEELLKNFDDIDREISRGLKAGKTTAAIAEGLFISVSAAKYRIKKMLIMTDLKNKQELTNLIKKYNLV